MPKPKPDHFRVNARAKSSKKQQPIATDHVVDIQNGLSEISPTLDALRIKQAYTFEYRRGQQCQGAEHGDYSPSRSFDSKGVWRQAAELLRSKSIDPLRYVRILFSDYQCRCFFNASAPKDSRPCTPADLVSDESFEIYQRALAMGRRAAEVDFIIQKNRLTHNYGYLKLYLPAWKCMYLALIDTWYNTQALVPLARFSFATQLIMPNETDATVKKLNDALREIADASYTSACYQYSTNEAGYSAVWPAQFLSPTIVRNSARVYESLISRIEF